MKTLILKGMAGAGALVGLVLLQACASESAPAEDMEAVGDPANEQMGEARSAIDGCGGIILRSCRDILNALPEAATGYYFIDPDGPNGQQPPFEVYCDMTSDGGGFTLLARTDTTRSFGMKPWVDIIAQNYFGGTSLTTTASVPPGYLSSYPFFALLNAEADMPFQHVRVIDGKNAFVQMLSSPRTLRQIHDANGVEPLYQNRASSGVLLLLGNAAHTSSSPCYYPNVNGQGCNAFYTGDTGSQSTAFYVGNLNICANGPAAGSLPGALWGSADCYGTDTLGGFGGFTYTRPANGAAGAYASGGYLNGAWSIYIR